MFQRRLLTSTRCNESMPRRSIVGSTYQNSLCTDRRLDKALIAQNRFHVFNSRMDWLRTGITKVTRRDGDFSFVGLTPKDKMPKMVCRSLLPSRGMK